MPRTTYAVKGQSGPQKSLLLNVRLPTRALEIFGSELEAGHRVLYARKEDVLPRIRKITYEYCSQSRNTVAFHKSVVGTCRDWILLAEIVMKDESQRR